MSTIVTYQILLSLLVGGTVYLLIWSLFRYPAQTEPPIHRRIALAVGAGQRKTIFEVALLKPVMSMLLSMADKLGFGTLRQQIRRDLDASGNPNTYSEQEYVAICLFCSLAMGLFAGVLGLMLGTGGVPFIVMFLAGLGFFIPLMALNGAAARRITSISKQLPYTLDLIALMMGAGSTFTEAVDTIVSDNPMDPLNIELQIVKSEIEFGANRSAALANMAGRIPLESLRSVVGAINQAEALGTPLSTILLVQANMIRMHRSVRAEKLAASASLRILVPSMLILIAVVITVFGPMILRYWSQGAFW
jgi:tight adherence protein C